MSPFHPDLSFTLHAQSAAWPLVPIYLSKFYSPISIRTSNASVCFYVYLYTYSFVNTIDKSVCFSLLCVILYIKYVLQWWVSYMYWHRKVCVWDKAAILVFWNQKAERPIVASPIYKIC